jgi:shikimate dehydrogenase
MKRLAVLGHPVSHSRSPAMQNAALAELGLAEEWSYEAIDVSPEDLAERVGVMSDEGFVGANVTIPHKEAALALADDASEAAAEIGAANTLSFAGNSLRADNTDAPGLIEALPAPPAGLTALVMGAGGSGRAAVWALARAGAKVEVWNRTPERADQLVRDLAGAGEGTEAEGLLAPVTTDKARATPYRLIVNCTAVGMPGTGDPFTELPVEAEQLGDEVTVVDLVYGGDETRLVAEARSRDSATVDGLEVLVRQGGESLRIWTGADPPIEAMRDAARAG